MRPHNMITNPFGNTILPSMPSPMQPEPIEEPKPISDPSTTALSVANPFTDNPAGLTVASGQGIIGGEPIRQYLLPILQQIKMKNQEELRNRIDPYVQEVQQLTDRTFPDLSLSGGSRGGIGSLFGGGMNQFQGGLDPISQNQVSNTIQSSPNSSSSPFGTASFFR